MERELLSKGPVLDKKGRPIPGYSRKSILTYDRKAIKAPPWRIKEWDFYQITNLKVVKYILKTSADSHPKFL